MQLGKVSKLGYISTLFYSPPLYLLRVVSRHHHLFLFPLLLAANAPIGSGQLINSLSLAQSQVTVPGSCTACLCSLFNDGIGGATIEVANLGDSGLRVVRNGSIAFSTRPQEHQFNMPFQLASPAVLKETDTAADADKYSFKVSSIACLQVSSYLLPDTLELSAPLLFRFRRAML